MFWVMPDPSRQPAASSRPPRAQAKLLAETSSCYRCTADWLRHPHHPAEQSSSMSHHWDVEADVVVVGFGAAGMAASVTAFELGAKVVILEKAPEGQEGGNTRVAGQGYLNTSSVEPALAYLTALCCPYTVPET